MNIVDKLIDYQKTRNHEILGVSTNSNSDNLIVIVTEILSWLKLERKREILQEQGKKVKNKPMELNKKYPWFNDLAEILESENALAEIFCVENNGLHFKTGVSDEYIHEARLLAYEKYNPPMIIG